MSGDSPFWVPVSLGRVFTFLLLFCFLFFSFVFGFFVFFLVAPRTRDAGGDPLPGAGPGNVGVQNQIPDPTRELSPDQWNCVAV